MNKILLDQFVLISAVKHALKNREGVVGIVVNIRETWDGLDIGTKNTIIKEVTKTIVNNDCDDDARMEWLKIYSLQ